MLCLGALRSPSTYLLLALLFQCYLGNDGSCPIECDCQYTNSSGDVILCTDKGLPDIPSGIDNEAHVLNVSGSILGNLSSQHFYKRGLINLRELYLSRCSLQHIDRRAFMELDFLHLLDLSHNDLHEVPGNALSFIQSLTTLQISYNPLHRIRSADFSLNNSLVEVDVSHCNINYIHPDAFADMYDLEHVSLSYNELRTINQIAAERLLALTKAVDLDNNPWQCDCEIKPLHYLSSMKQYLPSITCEHPPEMEGKILANVSFEDLICPPNIISLNGVEPIKVRDGGTAIFNCEAGGDPIPELSWHLGRFGDLIENATSLILNQSEVLIYQDIRESKVTSRLMMSNVQKRIDRHHFRCIADNKGGSAEKLFLIRVTSSAITLSLQLKLTAIILIQYLLN